MEAPTPLAPPSAARGVVLTLPACTCTRCWTAPHHNSTTMGTVVLALLITGACGCVLMCQVVPPGCAAVADTPLSCFSTIRLHAVPPPAHCTARTPRLTAWCCMKLSSASVSEVCACASDRHVLTVLLLAAGMSASRTCTQAVCDNQQERRSATC